MVGTVGIAQVKGAVQWEPVRLNTHSAKVAEVEMQHVELGKCHGVDDGLEEDHGVEASANIKHQPSPRLKNNHKENGGEIVFFYSIWIQDVFWLGPGPPSTDRCGDSMAKQISNPDFGTMLNRGSGVMICDSLTISG